MSASGGKDRSWLRPVDLRPIDGSDPERIIGTHRGASEALNVKNPQPGRRYYHGRFDSSFMQRMLNKGWRPIGSDDPERTGSEIAVDAIPELDGLKAFKDVLLLWMPEEQYNELHKDKARRGHILREGSTADYLDKGQDLQAQLDEQPEDDLYFKRGHHRYDQR